MRINDAKKFSELAAKQVSAGYIKSISMDFFQFEKDYCYTNQANSAKLAYNLFKDGGARAEMREIPADGKTANMDFIMPEAWDAYDAKLEVVSPIKEVISDYKTQRFMLPIRCPATKKGGVTGELIHEKDMDKKDIRGKYVLSFSYKMLGWNKLDYLKRGCAGIISGWAESGDKLPDSVFWTNGWTSGPGWFHTKEEPRLLMINVSYNNGKKLEKLLKKGKVVIKAMTDTKTYKGIQKTAVGLIPGKVKKEVAIFGHLYEPMPNDNCLCAAAMCQYIEIINRLIKEKRIPRPYYSIRFMLGEEKYGFAEFYKDPKRSKNIVANMNFDSIGVDYAKSHKPSVERYAPVCNTSFSDILLDRLIDKYNTVLLRTERGNFSDDSFMGDPLISAPCNWIIADEGIYHHQSQNTYDIVGWKGCEEKAKISLEYILMLAYMDPQAVNTYLPEITKGTMQHIDLEFKKLLKRASTMTKKELLGNLNFVIGWQLDRIASASKFGGKAAVIKREQAKLNKYIEKKLSMFKNAKTKVVLEDTPSPEERRAANLVPVRLVNYHPFDMKHEKNFFKRRKNVPYHESFVCWMDGKRDLWTVIKNLEMDYEKQFTKEQIQAYIKYAQDIAKLGYIKLVDKVVVKKKQITDGLRRLGINKGDSIIVHSSITSFGKVEGGPKTVISALMDTVGKNGLLMMPSFNHGKAVQNPPYYFDMKKTPSSNGVIADTFWRLPGVKRSIDPSHSFAAWGKNANSYLDGHLTSSTMGIGSPLELIERYGGKIILLGTGYGPNTFRHVVEMTNNVKCLGQRTEEYKVKLPSGKMIKARTWSWRNGGCHLLDDIHHAEKLMRERGLDKRVKIGNAEVIALFPKDFRNVAEELLTKGIPGKPNCKNCKMKIAFTGRKDGKVKSDIS